MIGAMGYFGYKNSQKSINFSNSPLNSINPFATPNPITDLKTYTNNKINFTINYPAPFKIREYVNDDSSIFSLGIGDNCIKISAYSKSLINNIQSSDAAVLDYIKYKNLKINETKVVSYPNSKTNSDNFIFKVTFKRLEDKNIDDESWFQLEKLNNYENNGVLPTYFIEKDGVYWSIESGFGAYGAACDVRAIDQILSTFRFLDKETFCGGIAGIRCGEGFTCKLEGNFPDAGGFCVSAL